MRAVVSLVCFALASCVIADPETSTETSALTESTTSVAWEPDLGCGPAKARASIPCDGNFIWPADQGITSVDVLLRKGPDGKDGPTYLEFVVWNQSTVGRILRATFGAKGANLRVTTLNITTARTSGGVDRNASCSGNVNGGVVPTPGPHIDDPLVFSRDFLTAAKTAARTIHVADEIFNQFSE